MPVPRASGRLRRRSGRPARATTCSRSRSSSRTGRASRSTATRCAGRSGGSAIGFTPREGLVLHTVSYEDGERERPVLHRASIAEMVDPLRRPGPGRLRKNAFDIGEYGIGPMANSLELGCDCLGEIRYFDAAHLRQPRRADHDQERDLPARGGRRHAVEAHRLGGRATSEVRRSRRLSCRSIVTVGNYEYGFYWYFYQDGTIQCEVKLTGIVLTSALAPARGPRTAARRARASSALNHQHFFCARLDMDVDGEANNRLRGEHRRACRPATRTRTATPSGRSPRCCQRARGPAADRPAARAASGGSSNPERAKHGRRAGRLQAASRARTWSRSPAGLELRWRAPGS